MAKTRKTSRSDQPKRESPERYGREEPTPECADAGLPMPAFTDRDIRLILKSLPTDTDAEKLRWLTEYLPHWAKHRLPIFLRVDERNLVGKPRRQVLDARKLATKLWETIVAFDPVTRRATIRALPPPPSIDDMEPFWWATDDRFAAGQSLFDQFLEQLQTFIHGLNRVETRDGPGQPRNIAPVIIIEDLARIFEGVTGLEAKRETNRLADEYEPYETGPFFDFVAAVWPVIFGSDEGLSSALKKWATAFSKTEGP
jgi:hypothetical protein